MSGKAWQVLGWVWGAIATLGAAVLAFFALRKKEPAAGPSSVQKKAEEDERKAMAEAEQVHTDAVAEAQEEKDNAVVLVRDAIEAKTPPLLEDDAKLTEYLKQAGKEVRGP